MKRRITLTLVAVLAAGLIAASTAGASSGWSPCWPEYNAINFHGVSPASEVTPPGGTLEVSYDAPGTNYLPTRIILFTGPNIVGRASEVQWQAGHGLPYAGTWDQHTDYLVGAVVLYGGHYWRALKAGIHEVPPETGSWWTLELTPPQGTLYARHVFTGLTPGTYVEAFERGEVLGIGGEIPLGAANCEQQTGEPMPGQLISGGGAAPLGAARIR